MKEKLAISKAWPVFVVIATVFSWAVLGIRVWMVCKSGFPTISTLSGYFKFYGPAACCFLMLVPCLGAIIAKKRESRALENLSVIFAAILFAGFMFCNALPQSAEMFTNFSWFNEAINAIKEKNFFAFGYTHELQHIIPTCGSVLGLFFVLLAIAFAGGKRRSVCGIIFGVIGVLGLLCSFLPYAAFSVKAIATGTAVETSEVIFASGLIGFGIFVVIGLFIIFLGHNKPKETQQEEVK